MTNVAVGVIRAARLAGFLALALAAAGCEVVINGRDAATLESTAAALRFAADAAA